MNNAKRIPYDYVKRVLDVLFGSVGLLVSLPIQAIVAMLVAAKLGGPVIFKQQRPGRGGAIFTLYKFRTMKLLDPSRGHVSEQQRMTQFGQVLRSTSLDELPSLFNVVRGDMSMVGPRPLLVEYLDRYTPEQRRRHEVRPGITGLAQASGRNAIDWDAKFRLDVEYVETRSFLLDAKIVLLTMISVARRNGVSSEGHVTTSKFVGKDATGDA